MSLALNELQKAIYTRLNSQLSPTSVYDHVPQNSTYPYVVIGEILSVPWDTKTADGQEFSVTVHVWDKGAGKKSVNLKMESVYTALHQQESNLSPSGFTVILIRCDYIAVFQETGEATDQDHYYHGVMRFRAIVEDT
jgi:hypothetical protein